MTDTRGACWEPRWLVLRQGLGIGTGVTVCGQAASVPCSAWAPAATCGRFWWCQWPHPAAADYLRGLSGPMGHPPVSRLSTTTVFPVSAWPGRLLAVLILAAVQLPGAVCLRAAEPDPEAIATPSAAVVEEVPGAKPETLGYALGYRIGSRVLEDHRGLGLAIDFEAFARGLADAVRGVAPAVPESLARDNLAAFDTLIRGREEDFRRRMAEAGRLNRERGKLFLEEQRRRPGVRSLPSGLLYEVLRQGRGATPRATDTVAAHYRGTRLSGEVFDATDPEASPAVFSLAEVVPGWQEALTRMPVGSRWRLILPPELAYGAEGSPPVIEPDEVLVFEVDLVEIVRDE
jgi:FKBP-type peptidyl-prolyl cis-trans isomerase FklB